MYSKSLPKINFTFQNCKIRYYIFHRQFGHFQIPTKSIHCPPFTTSTYIYNWCTCGIAAQEKDNLQTFWYTHVLLYVLTINWTFSKIENTKDLSIDLDDAQQ